MRTNNSVRSFVFVGLLSFVIVASLSSTACQRGTSLVIEMGTPLRFVVSGPGTLNHFQLSGPDLEREPNRHGEGERLMLSKVYWEVAQSGGIGRTLDEVGPIIYGKVPDGFVQVQPPLGAPPPLVERDLYNVRLSVNDDLGINRFFAIRDGKIVAEGER